MPILTHGRSGPSRYRVEARLSHKSAALGRTPPRPPEPRGRHRRGAKSTSAPRRGRVAVGGFDNDGPRSRTYATASGRSDSASAAGSRPRVQRRGAAEQPTNPVLIRLVPLCWMHHRAYDTCRLELLPHLEPQWRAEIAHAV